MGDEANDIMTRFGLTNDQERDYDVVKTSFSDTVVRRNAIFECLTSIEFCRMKVSKTLQI